MLHRRKKNRWLDKLLRHWLGTITHVTTPRPMVALTFDDGPHPRFTPRLLDILAAYGARATFFVVGEAAAQQRGLIRRMVDAGHVVGSHTWDHPSLPLINTWERRRQLGRWAAAVTPVGGQKFFRPPYGDQSLASRLDLWRAGYTVVTWNVVSGDWIGDDAKLLAARILPRLTPGNIVLLHDALYTAPPGGSFDRTATLAAVELILQHTQGQLQFVTVPELLQGGQPQMRNWRQQPDVAWLNALCKQQGEPRRYRQGGGRVF